MAQCSFLKHGLEIIHHIVNSVAREGTGGVPPVLLKITFGSLSNPVKKAGGGHYDSKYDCLINTFGLETPSFKVLNHIIQHFWSCTILNEPRDRPTRSNNDDDLSTECSTSTESSTSTKSLGNIEFESLRKHAGWAIKRARDLVQSGPAASKIQVSKADDSFCEVSKKNLLDIFKDLGEDVLVQPGKYLFIPNEEVVPVFLYLHSSLEKMVKSNLETDASKDVLKECLEALCEDKCLRDMWYGVLHLGSPEDLSLKASYVLVLQRIVVMFVKSKQQIICQQLQLKPKRQSSSLRQSLKKVTNNKIQCFYHARYCIGCHL